MSTLEDFRRETRAWLVWLADAMRQHIDIEKIYHIMQQHQEPSC